MNQNLAQHLPLAAVGVISRNESRLHFQDLPCRPIDRINVPLAVWKEEYLTGNQEIDREHQELFSLVNSLHRGMLSGKDCITLKLILQDLASHTLAHFQQEEMLMASCNYPRYERHKQAHDGLKTKVVDLIQKLNVEERLLTVAVTQFLTDWLVHHIQGEDRKMIEFLRQ